MSRSSTLQTRRLTGALGAEVRGISLRDPLDDRLVDEIRALLDEHLVLFFPDQHLDDDEHFVFARCFGGPYIHPLGRTLGRTTANVEHIVDDADNPPFQDKWHTDVSWDPTPPTYGVLRAIELPARGGDTIWVNMYAAYNLLSPAMQKIIEPLDAVHDMGSMQAFIAKGGEEVVARTREQFPGVAHPVVGIHPATGRPFLNVNAEFTREIEGLQRRESDVLLGLLTDHVRNPNIQHRHTWTVGEVAIWDERCTQHFAVADFMPERREMARVNVV